MSDLNRRGVWTYVTTIGGAGIECSVCHHKRGTVGPIAIAVSQSGEPILTSRAVVTPTAVDAYFNVTSPAIIDVPRGCCFDISVENISDSGDPINVQNANLVVERIA